jgi:hypothetical protein
LFLIEIRVKRESQAESLGRVGLSLGRSKKFTCLDGQGRHHFDFKLLFSMSSACPVKWLQVPLAQFAPKEQVQLKCRLYGFQSPEAKICGADLI